MMNEPVVSVPLSLARALYGFLIEADSQKAFGNDCGDYMDPTGEFCTVCTALEELVLAIGEAEGEEDDGPE